MAERSAERSVWHRMRTPIRSESEAFRLVLAGSLMVGAAVLIGWATEAVVGAAAFALALALSAITYLRAANPDRRAPLRTGNGSSADERQHAIEGEAQ